MQYYKIIETKFLPATDTQGSRVKAQDSCGNSVMIHYEHALSTEDNHTQAAQSLLAKIARLNEDSELRIQGYGPSVLGKGYIYMCSRE